MEVEAFSRDVVEAVGDALKLLSVDAGDVDLAREAASQSTDGVFDAAFLPWAVWVAEEGFDTEGLVELVVFEEL